MDLKGQILWADDEIDLLEPHILYLQNKGYSVTPVPSGEDAIQLCDENDYDLVLLDEMMTGLDGLTTLKHIKESHPDIPVIMITKNEEEWLMEEAIASQITNYLTKPVNPSQILLACKNVLETRKIQSDYAAQSYLKDFQEISNSISSADTIRDWYAISNKLAEWAIRFDELGDQGLGQILSEQHEDANKQFSQFVEDNYADLLQSDDLTLSPHILDTFVKPVIADGRDVFFIVIDCLRSDQWKAMEKSLYPLFKVQTDFHISMLPTATPFARNAIFSGLFPDRLPEKFPKQWQSMIVDDTSMNRYESEFLRDYLDRQGFEKKSMNYNKIITHEDGRKFATRINEYKSTNLLALVVNFVDMLGHSRSESNVLKEMIPDESAYRQTVCAWLEQSWLIEVLEQVSSWDTTVIITSDHGSIRVKRPVQIKGDRQTSDGIRFKYGRNLHISSKTGYKIDDIKAYRLPQIENCSEYIIAKDDYFYLYPNHYNRFVKRFENSFQHGGISMDEMIVPVGILTGKN